ncbi:helix-turn-helix domain-containing protein [Lysinibacillus sp. RC79]|uniref:helix-turn-helix domain-containing protein n=1 Tax=Lysinibacillus TaxID=400634 RepID=UPI0035144298
MEKINERIKDLRKSLNLNQATFANSIGISQAALSDLEKGKSKPSIETLIAISEHFNVSIDWIVKGEKYEDISKQKELPISYRKLNSTIMRILLEEKDTLTEELNIPLQEIHVYLSIFIANLYNSHSVQKADEKYIIAMLNIVSTEDRDYILKIIQDIILFKYKSKFQTPDIC